MTAKAAIAILLLSAVALAVFAGCGGMAGNGSDTPTPTSQPTTPVATVAAPVERTTAPTPAVATVVAQAEATVQATVPVATVAPPVERTTAPPPAVATAVAQAEATVQASYAKSGAAYCGRLCQPSFWRNATVADLDAEISKGASVNAKDGVSGGGRSPLHHAVQYADLAVIAALLDRGADVDAKTDGGSTALHIIAGLPGDHHTPVSEVAALLLERGADANAQSGWRGYSPLHYAGDPVMAVLLLNYGADVNQKSDSGTTPLHTAVGYGPAGFYVNGDIALVTLLLEHGADVNAVNDSGQTPLLTAVIYAVDDANSAAQYEATADAVALLLEHGADIGERACQELKYTSSRSKAVVEDLVCP